MFETKFFINGERVSYDTAKTHWLNSNTYAQANSKTRHLIWTIATKGNEHGNHNPNGEVEHLEEAGIKLGA